MGKNQTGINQAVRVNEVKACDILNRIVKEIGLPAEDDSLSISAGDMDFRFVWEEKGEIADMVSTPEARNFSIQYSGFGYAYSAMNDIKANSKGDEPYDDEIYAELSNKQWERVAKEEYDKYRHVFDEYDEDDDIETDGIFPASIGLTTDEGASDPMFSIAVRIEDGKVTGVVPYYYESDTMFIYMEIDYLDRMAGSGMHESIEGILVDRFNEFLVYADGYLKNEGM